ncbi:MAG: amidohydrolase family protein [Bacteroidales bacterium]|nr:amidohydrolase family protein [Bacteroidales bacterium]
MRRIAANYIFPVSTPALKNGIVEVDDDGRIIRLIDTKGDLKESGKLEFYNGVIIPGFINTHCHLELSELKGKIKSGNGLPGFIKEIIKYKKTGKPVNALSAIKLQDSFMRNSGIVAVADISNTNTTIQAKIISKIYYHTFCEVTGAKKNSEETFINYESVYYEFVDKGLNASIVPHAAYSVSPELFRQITDFAQKNKSVISIHNQETESENQMFISNNGALFETLKSINAVAENNRNTGKNSLESITGFLPKKNNIIFVHNTYTSKSDINRAAEHFNNAYWCLCPLSNLYIENKLPDLNIFVNMSDNVTLGTDSLASNSILSILEEMKVLGKHFPDISFNDLLKWGTLNGARALQIENIYGSLEKGKIPGLNLISDFDFENMQLKEKSQVKVLV